MINTIIQGHTLNVLKTLPAESVNCVVTSPPYWGLRDYGIEPVIWGGDKNCMHKWGNKIITLKHKSGETNPGKESWFKDRGASDDKGSCFCQKCGAWRGSLGLEPTFELYIKHLCDIFDEIKRVLRKDGTCWVNIGDSYGGFQGKNAGWPDSKTRAKVPQQLKPKQYAKSLLDIPHRFSIEMTNRGWIKRNTIIWHKPNCMPSSARDRFTIDFEYLFFFTKSNKALFWINEKTLECVDKKPPGTKGIEGKDWEWREVGNYEGKDIFNVRVRDANKAKFLQGATEEEKENYGKGKKKKVSLWTGHDYWFEQQFEVHSRDWTNCGGNIAGKGKHKKHNGYEEVNRKKVIPNPNGRNKRSVWTIPEANFEVYPEGLKENCGKGKRKKVSLWTGHDYWFEQQLEEFAPNTLERTKYSNSKKNKMVSGQYPVSLESYDRYAAKVQNGSLQGRNKRAVWIVPTQPFPEAHFAVYPEGLIEIPIKAGCPEFICKKCGMARVKMYKYKGGTIGKGWHDHSKDLEEGMHQSLGGLDKQGDEPYRRAYEGYTDCGCNAGFEPGIVLDPFMGAGTTALVALKQRKRFIGIEIKQEYIDMAKRRIKSVQPNLF